MTDMTVCANCGNPVNLDVSFCKSCGAPVNNTVVETAPSEGVSVASVTTGVCSSCGLPAGNPGQKFCASCGGPIVSAPAATKPNPATEAAGEAASMPKPSMPMPQPVVNPDAQAVSAPSAPQDAPAFPMPQVPQTNGADFQAKLDSFMGASIDTSKVGSDFNASSVVLDSDDTAALSAAFSFFGKSFDDISQPAYNPAADLIEKRRRREEDAEAKTKEERDFSPSEGYQEFGIMASNLNPEVCPAQSIVEKQRDEALRNVKKSRLKHEVQLGEIGQREAVEEASKL